MRKVRKARSFRLFMHFEARLSASPVVWSERSHTGRQSHISADSQRAKQEDGDSTVLVGTKVGHRFNWRSRLNCELAVSIHTDPLTHKDSNCSLRHVAL